MIPRRAVQECLMPRANGRIAIAALLSLVCFFAAVPVEHAAHGPDEHVGNVNFPTSCSVQAQPAVDRGLALLHSFQYQESSQAFGDAAERDAQCSMAYWGKAMSLYHQLWDFPDASDLAEGRKDVAQAQKAGSKTPRERQYIAATAAFFQDDPKLSHTDRTQAYSAAMQKLFSDNPNDV